MSANQSRRRTDSSLGPISSTKVKIDSTLPYLGRELDENSTRLVEIQPAAQESDPVVCKLSEVTFASRPKSALAIVQTIKQTISPDHSPDQ
jgi:hypothetical protein